MKKAIITRINDFGNGIKSFTLALDEKIIYKPGQYVMIAFEEDPATTRAFSIAESSGANITLYVKLHREFTARLFRAEEGEPLLVKGPYGRFTLPQDAKSHRHVFVAGGIGITPIYSMVREAESMDCDYEIYYSAPREEEMMLLEEIKSSCSSQKMFFLTQEKKDGFENRRISADDVCRGEGCYYYICGPEQMINCLRESLIKRSVPSERIKSELFT